MLITCILYCDARPSCYVVVRLKLCYLAFCHGSYSALSGIARFCCSVTSRTLEIRSVSSKLCFLHPEFAQAFHLLSSMFRFIPSLFVLAPHDLNLAKFRCLCLLTGLCQVYICELVT